MNYYTAFEEMQKKNQAVYGNKYDGEIGPKQPQFCDDDDLKSASVRFIHKSCVNLRHSSEITKQEESGEYRGKSSKKGDIPFNMQMDIERLTLANALKRFIETGSASNAFDVYFCYLEMFVGSYSKTKSIIEQLCDFEKNSGTLLMKHRDHYVHSVYVFALGLAIFETNSNFRKIYEEFYKNNLSEDETIAHHFLRYWGLASLFHDIGYPFELVFEQAVSYFEVQKIERKAFKENNVSFAAYKNIKGYTELSEENRDRLKSVTNKEFNDTNALFAHYISERIGNEYNEKGEKSSPDQLVKVLQKKPDSPDKFGYYMDHAFFSANILIKKLLALNDFHFTEATIDSLTAILMHNSLYKFSITRYKEKKHPFKAELHPIAYLLMYCDELQCWDRVSYGRESKTQLHPFDCKFKFSYNKIEAVYCFDESQKNKINKFKDDYEKDKKTELKSYSSMVNENAFKSDIEKIVDTSIIRLSVEVKLKSVENEKKHTYISDCNFIDLYNLAIALHNQYTNNNDTVDMENDFDNLSLEYKLSNILQAKTFEQHLDSIGCFYTSRPVDYEMVDQFTDSQLEKIGNMEHERWDKEKNSMCWLPVEEGELEQLCRSDKRVREQTRMHYDFKKSYDSLDADTQNKDKNPLNTMLKKLMEFDGSRIYKYK